MAVVGTVTAAGSRPTGGTAGHPLTQISNHPPRIFIKPLTGPNPVQRKGSQNGGCFLAGSRTDGCHQIPAESRRQAIQALLQRQVCRETGSVELVHQSIQAALAQCGPTRLRSEGSAPGLHLSGADPRRRFGGGGLFTTGTPPLPALQLSLEPGHLATQRIVLRQQGLNIAGHPLVLPVTAGPVAWIKAQSAR